MTKEESCNVANRERLLDAAEILFAQRGFDGVTVRAITRKAQCNQAAVNYYFRSKKSLYLEVFRTRWIPRSRRIQNSFWNSLQTDPLSSPELVIRSLVKAFLHAPISDEERIRQHQLIARELAQPGEAFELIITEAIEPFLNELATLLRRSLAQESTDHNVMLDALSILSQVFYFALARNMVRRITAEEHDEAFTERLVDHITNFSVNGLQGVVRKKIDGNLRQNSFFSP
ncbi:MAG: CerR family C-terminal domain-containing protein [Deltaproteobacteria bacterium]|nr:CerR family C-terminal domain-containing protein [Deltaproteobacteria bacterium]